MTEVGIPPTVVIRSATITTSQLLGIGNKLGTIQSGKIADLIAVNENPLSNIKTRMNVKFVIKETIFRSLGRQQRQFAER